MIRPPSGEREAIVLGLPLLRTVNLVIDGREKKLWSSGGSTKPCEPDYSRSGLWIERRNDQAVVTSVGVGSSAAAGQVKENDIIEEPSDWEKLRSQLRQPAGSVLSLVVSRDGVLRNVELELMAYL